MTRKKQTGKRVAGLLLSATMITSMVIPQAAYAANQQIPLETVSAQSETGVASVAETTPETVETAAELETGIVSAEAVSETQKETQAIDNQTAELETQTMQAETADYNSAADIEESRQEYNASGNEAGLSYRINLKNEATITGYTGSASDVVIPSTIAGAPVKDIDYSAFKGNTTITSVTIANAVQIESHSFEGCTALKSVEINTSDADVSGAKLDYQAFFNCTALEKVVISGKYTEIGSNTFSGCTKLSILSLADSIATIKSGAFAGCIALQVADLPESLTDLGISAFENCTGLKKVMIGSNVKSLGDGCFKNCTALTSVTLQDGVAEATIGISAFASCNSITEITIPGNYTTIGNRAFNGCTVLKTVNYKPNTISSTSQSIGYGAFNVCAQLSSITLPSTLSSIGEYAFSECTSLNNLTIPTGVKVIDSFAFYKCTGLTVVTCPSTLETLGERAFSTCNALKRVTLVAGNNNCTIGDYVFYNCTSITAIEIPGNYVSIGLSAFSGCSNLMYVNYAKSAHGSSQAIGSNAFNSCEKLTEVVLPETLAKMDKRVFAYCKSLKEITLPSNLKDVNADALTDSYFLKVTNNSSVSVNLPSSISSNWYNEADNATKITAIANGTAVSQSKYTGTTVYNGIDYSAVYDMNYYADHNPDVVKALGRDSKKLIWHFVEFGMPEGRVAKGSFNAVNYMYCLLNDDLRAAFGGDMKQYYYHYMNYGQYEGRSISDYDAIFDPVYYLATNPDVYDNIVSRYTSDGNTLGWALWHYYEYGMNEGRRGSAEFGVLNYEAANADIWSAYKDNYRQATIHYLQFGTGRATKGKYDMYTLATVRPDVVSVLGANNPQSWISWYVTTGQYE